MLRSARYLHGRSVYRKQNLYFVWPNAYNFVDLHIKIVTFIFHSSHPVTTLIQCFEHISGAHMNPAITIAMMLVRHTGIIKGILYIIAQSVGACTAILLMQGYVYGWMDGEIFHQAKSNYEYILTYCVLFWLSSWNFIGLLDATHCIIHQ